MEQVAVLAERIQSLKAIAASMQEGAIHTRLIPEIDKILALPDDLATASVGDREAVARQLREYEQAFDGLGYALLEQLMPTVGVSSVFEIVQAADAFKTELRQSIGRRISVAGEERTFEARHYEALSRYGLSIGTPPVTDEVCELVGRTVFGKAATQLYDFIETLAADPTELRELFDRTRGIVDSSLHYCTAAEEAAFLREATEFTNFEGSRLFNRAVVTADPARVIHLIKHHVFDKFSPGNVSAVTVVDGVDQLDSELAARMRDAPNQVFVAAVTRIPYGLFQDAQGQKTWRSVLGRLVLIDASERARASNTTVVHTLFPHVARTLRNVQTGFAGRPANTQLQLRRLLERFSAETLQSVRHQIERQSAFLEREGATGATVGELHHQDWRRASLFDYLTLVKLRRFVGFVEAIAASDADQRAAMGQELRRSVAKLWARYFYGSLDADRYSATVVPGGGRGALAAVGEAHREAVRSAAEAFRRESLSDCWHRLEQIKAALQIPNGSTDEIQAAIKQSQLRSVPPTGRLPNGNGEGGRLRRHVARAVLYRMADTAGRLTRRTQSGLDRAAFGNLTGGVAAYVKSAMAGAGFGALHGKLEQVVRDQWGRYDRSVRRSLVPAREIIRAVRDATDGVKAQLDPVAVGDIEAVLKSIEQGVFYPTLVLPELSWTYADVFPEKHYPKASVVRIPVNERHEMDPLALLQRLEELRHLLRPLPEVFELVCRSMLLVLNTPHNPTGVVYRRETVSRLLLLASEYDLCVVDDNAYHKLVSKACKARQGDGSAAELYEQHRAQFGRPLRLVTVGASTKGLQGAGDRTGFICSTDRSFIEFAERRATAPHLLSLYLTKLKLESGLAIKKWTRTLEQMSVDALDPTAAHRLTKRLGDELSRQAQHFSRDDFPAALFETLLDGHEDLVRIEQRGASVAEVSGRLSELVVRVKQLRLERALRNDIQRRVEQVQAARQRAMPEAADIDPDGAFYYCVRLCDPERDQGVQEFLRTLCRYRKVDVTYAGRGYVRLSLGGLIAGDAASYGQLGHAVEVYLRLLQREWRAFQESGRDPQALTESLCANDGTLAEQAMADLAQLVDLLPADATPPAAARIRPDERGTVFCIEEGRSVTDKVFVRASPCSTVGELLASRAFQVVYRRLLRKVHRRVAALSDLDFVQVENQYGPHGCLMAYRDRQLIDSDFRELLRHMYGVWQGSSTVKVLAAELDAGCHEDKVAALHGKSRRLGELVDELMNAFELSADVVPGGGTFDLGYEELTGLHAHPSLPKYLQLLIEGCRFAGATTPLDPCPTAITGATRRISDYRYGFLRRDGRGAGDAAEPAAQPDRAHFAERLVRFAALTELSDYVCKAVQVGPFKILLVMHKSCFHLLSDELRLFPQLQAVQRHDELDRLRWDGALLFGLPSKVAGDTAKTGYIIERRSDDRPLPVAWVAREDATDYVGFLKKSLLTVHNELVKELGGLPVHGAMITITFKNGLRKTLVFSADSGTGKSETITAMMEQVIAGTGPAAELRDIDILACDMLSLWRGEDEQIYAFGTETGDFLRLNDITGQWKAHFGDLLRRGATSNPEHPTNARVTIPGICAVSSVLSPTRVNGFFYVNNYEAVAGSAVELGEDPHHTLGHVLVRGLRKNKGTSGDQPSLRAGLELAGRGDLVVRFRHSIDELLEWQPRTIQGRQRQCLVYRDGAHDVFAAQQLVTLAFRGQTWPGDDTGEPIASVEHDLRRNVFWVVTESGAREPLCREGYDSIYDPLTSTFCGNPFVDPEGMDQTLERFASTMLKAKVHTGVIRTELARPGCEFSGPAKAARDIVEFLLEDEEVNARFQRNKDEVHRAMREAYGGVWEPGSNLPVELEGYNLLLLEEHESTHVAFVDGTDGHFSLATPHYNYDPSRGSVTRRFTPAIALPETIAIIADVCSSEDYWTNLAELEVEPAAYDGIRTWSSPDELAYQVLLVHGVINLGSSPAEVARFPFEVRKARHVADWIARSRGGPSQ